MDKTRHLFEPIVKNRSCCIFFVGLLFLTACGGSSGGDTTFPFTNDADGDGLTDSQEVALGTDPKKADTDDDRIWDEEEIEMFGTNPRQADTDGDSMKDGADPQPKIPNSLPLDPGATVPKQYAVFTNNAAGTAPKKLIETHYEQNHIVYAPTTAAGAPFLIYQTYLTDTSGDGLYDEGDLPGTAIAIMNTDGTRPRLLTDLDADGMRADNGAIDATPEPSPDGQFIIFVSDRHNIGNFDIALYVMGIDGSNVMRLSYAANAPAADEIDADPHWGPGGNTISFKRQKLTPAAEFSRVYTANIDTSTMTLSNLVERTDGSDTALSTPGPGDYDPKVSPNGQFITSYRHLDDGIGIFGNYDIWVGPFSDPAQPGDASVQILDADPNSANLFPRWNLSGDKLAVWRVTPSSPDPIDIFIFDLTIQASPFSVTATAENITGSDGWIETMPSWQTDPAMADMLIYSASR